MKKTFAALFLVIVFFACSNSDQHLYDENALISISTEIFMTKSFDSTSTRVKSDTISEGDSLIFLANISPSKSIKTQKYYWTLDDKYWASDFNFRDAIFEAGHHEICFFLIDYFGDTISDTLNLWISRPPVLNTKNYIPLDQTQGFRPNRHISFSWKSYDPDSLLDLTYHFQLKQLFSLKKETILQDTVIRNSFFTYHGELPPLSKFEWNVYAVNDYGIPSHDTLYSTFFTGGYGNEAGIIVNCQTSSHQNISPVTLHILDEDNHELNSREIEVSSPDGIVSIAPIPAGRYNITAEIPSASDFKSDTLKVSLKSNEVAQLDTLRLIDTIPPIIEYLPQDSTDSSRDTIPFADTLLFALRDGGSTNHSLKSIEVQLDGENIYTWKYLGNDTLVLHLDSSNKAWFYRFLQIRTSDNSENTASKTFTLFPAKSWIICNADTTIQRTGTIFVQFQDTNPYGFKPDTFYIQFPFIDYIIKRPAKNESESHINIPASYFTDSINVVNFSIRYTNGLIHKKSWIVTVDTTREASDEN